MMLRLPPVTRRAVAMHAALALAALSGCSSATGPGRDPDPGPPVASCTFTNPVLRGADPSVVRRGATYYTVQSANNAITVYRSDRLSDPARNGVTVWTAPTNAWNRANIWAPELQFINGRWYIYYAAGPTGPRNEEFINQRSFVLESATDDPQGAWAEKAMLWTGDGPPSASPDSNVWGIDFTVGRINGQLYGVWSGWERNQLTDLTPQHLYIAPMSNPWTVGGPRVKLSSPTASWEDGPELDLQEGPVFLERAGQTFIVYSTRESWLPDYRLGLLRLTNPAAPLDPASYVKTGPIFASANGVFGVGHNAFTTSPDSTEDWIVYHAKTSTAPGWDRVIRMQKFGWNADGSPNLGTPVASGTPQARPAGECTTR
ncbi:MAG TPA: glycoside hydrolase family 43 protein [Gemmatirosa sp.]|nr:glycoside hydrolase family 43 protein [Gemmatirosa sp.]